MGVFYMQIPTTCGVLLSIDGYDFSSFILFQGAFKSFGIGIQIAQGQQDYCNHRISFFHITYPMPSSALLRQLLLNFYLKR